MILKLSAFKSNGFFRVILFMVAHNCHSNNKKKHWQQILINKKSFAHILERFTSIKKDWFTKKKDLLT